MFYQTVYLPFFYRNIHVEAYLKSKRITLFLNNHVVNKDFLHHSSEHD